MPEDSTPEGAAPAPIAAPSSGVRTFVGLFVVPLLVVILCVGIFVLFGWAAYERRSVGDYLQDLRDSRSFFAHRRKQAAYELSKILSANPEALREDHGAAEELRRLFTTTDDLWVRRYLALVLGHTGDEEAVPLLVEGAGHDDSQLRIYSLWALGAIAHSGGFVTLEAALTDTDPGIRKTAAYALGSFEDRAAAVAALVPLVDDPVADVRWNAALALARLGSTEGVEVLEQMLERRLLAQIPGITPQQQEEAMISALRALVHLRVVLDRATLDRLAEEDPSLKVRQAAIEARRSRDADYGGSRPPLGFERQAGTPAGLTPPDRFDYIRPFPANPGSLLPLRQGRV
ncbi:MAG TPA: HEAT repeat domain-containing protein [Thermoanaerobaculia bacterium]|nr:HEAT repeat domain-containing protein [Thermoanaerobaculia bacterium]